MEEKDKDAFAKVIQRNEELEKELDHYKQKTPLVGLRWYGGGGFSIGLSSTVAGMNKVILDGYGDKAVIDYASWLRIRNTEAVNDGVCVRDDDVIDEMGIAGIKAKPDQKRSINGYTDDEIISFLNGPTKKLKDLLKEITHHFCIRHFVTVYKKMELSDEAKLSVLRERYRYLFSKFRWGLLNKHDLRIGCENADINFENLSEEEMVEILVKLELKSSDMETDL